jgi:hypothetical protein
MTVEQDQSRVVIARLARPHTSGGYIIGEASIRAEGSAFPALKEWILAHGGAHEAPPAAVDRGLHGDGRGQVTRPAPHYVLPPSAFE